MNDCIVYSDNKSVYITLIRKMNSFAKWGLIALNALLYVFLFGQIITKTLLSEKLADLLEIGGLLFLSFGVFYFMTKPTFWNVLGKEYVVITRRSISFQKDFGFYMSNFKTVALNNEISLQICQPAAQETNNILLNFLKYDQNDLPQFIYQTGIKIDREKYNFIVTQLKDLYEGQLSENYWFSAN